MPISRRPNSVTSARLVAPATSCADVTREVGRGTRREVTDGDRPQDRALVRARGGAGRAADPGAAARAPDERAGRLRAAAPPARRAGLRLGPGAPAGAGRRVRLVSTRRVLQSRGHRPL